MSRMQMTVVMTALTVDLWWMILDMWVGLLLCDVA